jgi:Holliday junction resolvasome RuvABC endonuclease subunit
MNSKTYIGIDPGWKNLGLAVLEYFDDKTLKSKISHTLDPSSFTSITKFVDYMDSVIAPLTTSLSGVTIERFVAYNTIHTAESEKINMLIGALCYYFGCKHLWNVEINLVRAIEW